MVINKFTKVSYDQYQKDGGGSLEEYDNIKLPQRATSGSAGYDIYSPIDFDLQPNQTILIKTGIRIRLDNDKYLAIFPRSGQGFKFKIQLWNTCGIIDSDYFNSDNEGHIMIKLFNDSPEGKTMTIKAGTAIAQGIINRFYTTINDSPITDNRNGGFGSTG